MRTLDDNVAAIIFTPDAVELEFPNIGTDIGDNLFAIDSDNPDQAHVFMAWATWLVLTYGSDDDIGMIMERAVELAVDVLPLRLEREAHESEVPSQEGAEGEVLDVGERDSLAQD